MREFKEYITVDHISSDLKCWDCDSESREEAIQFMEDMNYNLLGIRKEGKLINKVITDRDKIKDIKPDEIIPDTLGDKNLLVLSY